MNMQLFLKLGLTLAITCGTSLGVVQLMPTAAPVTSTFDRATHPATIKAPVQEANQLPSVVDDNVIVDSQIQLCQGFGYASPCGCQGACDGSCGQGPVISGAGLVSGPVVQQGQIVADGFGYGTPSKMMRGVDQSTPHMQGREPRFRRAGMIPFEQFAYGEYIGPHRTPHVPEYKLRVGDVLEFVYIRTREKSLYPYQFYVGDVLDIRSESDPELNQSELTIRSDGRTTFALIGEVMVAGKTVKDLQRELNDKYSSQVIDPAITVQVRQSETPLQDIINSVDARQGQGGQTRRAEVIADGTLALPAIGSVPAVGLTLNEIAREVNARYRLRLGGIEVTPTLLQNSPRFIYVIGEVNRPGRYEITNGPTSALQALALAEGYKPGGNVRQIVVFRRDQNWQLTATKLDLAGALNGYRPLPSDEIWLRHSDIVLVPKKPIQRLSEAVNLYLSNTLYSIFPQQGVAFNFDDFTTL